ncbi:hypothetical protein VU11_07555 [Desulfobulbus sp. US2]|nr:hypothetical protein [Desulfobulbus sp. US2]
MQTGLLLFLVKHLFTHLGTQADKMAILIFDRDFPTSWGIRAETEIAVPVGATGLEREFGIRGDNLHNGVAHRFTVLIGSGCAEGFTAVLGFTVDCVGMSLDGKKRGRPRVSIRSRKPCFVVFLFIVVHVFVR